jgi:VIT1/CCC1 family predicted Fe2+/Mn2+ transporter
MAELLPELLLLAPQLAKYLFGTRSVMAAAAVREIVNRVTGTVDPAAQAAAFAEPGKQSELRLELAQLTARLDQEQRATDLALFQAQVADVANARSATLSLQAGHSAIAWGAPIVSTIVLGTFGAMLGCLMTFHIPDSALALANIMLGNLATMAMAVVSYWVGSSAGSKAKDVTIADATRNLAVSSPPPMLAVAAPPT